jgi:hypothetical protein
MLPSWPRSPIAGRSVFVNLRTCLAPAAFGVIAFVGESILHDAPDWLIFVVAVIAGVLVAGLMRLVDRRR